MKSIYALLVTCCLLLLSGCGPKLYTPNAINTPLFSKKGAFKAAVGVRPINGPVFDFQSAYAFTNHWAIMSNADFNLHRSSFLSRTEETKKYGEFGLGYFGFLSKNPPKDFAYRFELFAGAGRGFSEDVQEEEFSNKILEYEANFEVYFLQPFIGYTTERVKVCFGARLAHIHFISWRQRERWSGHWKNNGTLSFGMIEPACNINYGLGRMTLLLYLKSSFPLYNTQQFLDVSDFSFLTVGIGMQYSIE
jgi:hypothetical protein